MSQLTQLTFEFGKKRFGRWQERNVDIHVDYICQYYTGNCEISKVENFGALEILEKSRVARTFLTNTAQFWRFFSNHAQFPRTSNFQITHNFIK